MYGVGRQSDAFQMIVPGENESHRIQNVDIGEEVLDISRPNSNFDVVEQRFPSFRAIHRCFSIARLQGCATCVIEPLKDLGLLKDDTDELREMGYRCNPINYRISFWRKKLSGRDDVQECEDSNFVGYLIARNDGIAESKVGWYVFESVFPVRGCPYVCVPRLGEYCVTVLCRRIYVRGVMFCQQNGINKSCAHVALRSLLSRRDPARDISYARINAVAKRIKIPGECLFFPGDGLHAVQIEAVLKEHGVHYKQIDYERAEEAELKKWQETQPDWLLKNKKERDADIVRKRAEVSTRLRRDIDYCKFLYDGAESGWGGLLGFRTFDGRVTSKHMIPIFGHTFNKDSWVSDSRKFYFRNNGGDTISAYVQSGCWTSDFVGHDDNLGLNFCIPKAYVKAEDVDYVAELYWDGVVFPGVEAEAVAHRVLLKLKDQLDTTNAWIGRFAQELPFGNVVYRSLSIAPDRYLKHLEFAQDWHFSREDTKIVEGFRKTKLPSALWVVEVSLPQLFPANERKVGEVVIDATSNSWLEDSKSERITGDFLRAILWIRMPGSYYYPQYVYGPESSPKIKFETSPRASAIQSHMPIIDLSSCKDLEN